MATPTFILPSAPTYTEGFVNGLNVYPNPTNFVANQVPFTRATTATRTNAAGLIELVPYNLVQYSEMFTQGIWTKSATNVLPNTIAAPDGTMTADTIVTNAVTQCLVRQSISFNVSQYTLTIYAKKGNIAFNYVELGNSYATFNMTTGAVADSGIFLTGWTFLSATSETLSNGWYRFTLSSQCTTAGSYGGVRVFHAVNVVGNLTYPTIGDFGYIWGAQLVEGTDALPYQLTETRLNRPRVDFSLGGCPNLLLEPQRTNLLSYSEQFDDASWSKVNLTVAANSSVSPSGILNADTLTPSATNTQHGTTKSTTFAASTSYTLSVYFKPNGYTSIALRMALDAIWAGGVAPTVTFETTTMTATVTTGIPTYKFEDVGNGWYWCSITATTSVGGSSGVTFYVKEYFPYLANGTSGVFLWGAQLEAGAYPTSYIPTSSASVTRNSDTFQFSNVFTNNLISSAGGTWFVDLKNNIDIARSGSAGGIFLNTGTISLAGDGFLFRNPSTFSQKINIIKYTSGTSLTLYNTLTENVKAAIKWNGTTADVFVNGVKVVTETPFTPTAMENLIGQGQNRTLHINSMALWNTPLTDDELEVITGEGFDTYALMASNYNYILQ